MVTSSTDITVYDRVTDPAALIETLGKSMYEARMFGCSNEAQGRVLALACIAERKNPLELVRTYHIIDGKLSMRADAMLAEFRKLGGKVRWVATGDDGKEAKAVFSFEDVDTEIGYTIDDAKRAGLVKDKSAWVKDPGAMLRARVTSKGIRMLAPEIVAGYYTPEEIDDANGSREAKPATVVDAETLAKAAAAKVAGNGKAADAAGDVIDAEFVEKPAETKAVEQPKPAATATTTAKPAATGKPCTAVQREKIKELFDAVGLSTEQQTKALERRNAKVIRNLTGEQAAELIATLETKLAAIQAAASEPAEETNISAAVDNSGPCTADQVAAIKSLLAESGDPELTKKIAAKLAEAGLSKVAEMTWHDAVVLHRALDCKSMGEFFEASLSKPVTAEAISEPTTEADSKN